MKRLLLIAILSLGLSSSSTVFAEEISAPAGTIVKSLHSPQTDRVYKILIHLPSSYKSDAPQRYPTVYLNDAQWDFTLVSSIVEKLTYDKVIPPLILVGITYGGESPDYPALRERDLTPTKVADINPNSGDAPLFLEFLAETLVPHIEDHYQTDPTRRVIAGTSYGGLFTLYSLYERPELFSGYIANSPAVLWDDSFIIQRHETFPYQNHAIRLSVTHGELEETNQRDAVHNFQELLDQHPSAQIGLQQWVSQLAGHASCGIVGWTRGLAWTLGDTTP